MVMIEKVETVYHLPTATNEEKLNASTEGMCKIEILPSSDFSEEKIADLIIST